MTEFRQATHMYLSTALKRIDLDCGRTMVSNTLIVRLPGSPAHTFFLARKGRKQVSMLFWMGSSSLCHVSVWDVLNESTTLQTTMATQSEGSGTNVRQRLQLTELLNSCLSTGVGKKASDRFL